MREKTLYLVFFAFVYSQSALALEIEELVYLQKAVLEICRGGDRVGNYSKTSVIASGEGKIIVIKGFAEGGADVKVEVNKGDWDGIQALAEREDYTQCVESTLKLLLASLEKG